MTVYFSIKGARRYDMNFAKNLPNYLYTYRAGMLSTTYDTEFHA